MKERERKKEEQMNEKGFHIKYSHEKSSPKKSSVNKKLEEKKRCNLWIHIFFSFSSYLFDHWGNKSLFHEMIPFHFKKRFHSISRNDSIPFRETIPFHWWPDWKKWPWLADWEKWPWLAGSTTTTSDNDGMRLVILTSFNLIRSNGNGWNNDSNNCPYHFADFHFLDWMSQAWLGA